MAQRKDEPTFEADRPLCQKGSLRKRKFRATLSAILVSKPEGERVLGSVHFGTGDDIFFG